MLSRDMITRACRTKEYAHRYPAFFVGSQASGHLFALREPLNIICMTPVFSRPKNVQVIIDGCKYWIRAWSRGVQPIFANQIIWGIQENLLEALGELGAKTASELNVVDIHRLTKSHVNIGWIASSIVFSKIATIGIQVPAGFYSQSFSQGIPQCPIQATPAYRTSEGRIGLWLAVELSSEILYGLPYNMSEVYHSLSMFSDCGLEILDTPINSVAFSGIINQ
jgi:hypothetical protein